MKLPALVAAAQVMSAVMWLLVAYHYLPSLTRVARQAFHLPVILLTWDGAGCWAALIGVVQTLFSVRWIALGHDDVAVMDARSLTIWIVLYVMNAACAIGVLHTWRDSRTDAASIEAAGRRASDAMAAWLGLAVVCIGAASWSL